MIPETMRFDFILEIISKVAYYTIEEDKKKKRR